MGKLENIDYHRTPHGVIDRTALRNPDLIFRDAGFGHEIRKPPTAKVGYAAFAEEPLYKQPDTKPADPYLLKTGEIVGMVANNPLIIADPGIEAEAIPDAVETVVTNRGKAQVIGTFFSLVDTDNPLATRTNMLEELQGLPTDKQLVLLDVVNRLRNGENVPLDYTAIDGDSSHQGYTGILGIRRKVRGTE